MIGTVLLLSGGIFAVGMIGGWIPLLKDWGVSRLNFFIAFGGGTLLGAALFLMIPESFALIEADLPFEETDAGFVVAWGMSIGFLLMFLMEHLALPHLGHEEEMIHTEEGHGNHVHSHHVGTSAFVALSLHTLIDGIALGAAVAGGEEFALGGLIFFAIVFHKVPAAFSLTSALKGDHFEDRKALIYLAIFNFMVPFGAATSFLLLEGFSTWMIGAMLGFSAGTFLQVATSDLLPVIHRQEKKGGLSLTVVVGLCVMATFGWLGVG
jgi:zinc and cadmium transporter